jgi:putative addiction module CopG family antidote
MDVPLNEREKAYIQEQIRSGQAASEEEVLRAGLQLLMQREAEDRRAYDAWREEARRKIEIGYQQAIAGELIDGEEAFARARVKMEARRNTEP